MKRFFRCFGIGCHAGGVFAVLVAGQPVLAQTQAFDALSGRSDGGAPAVRRVVEADTAPAPAGGSIEQRLARVERLLNNKALVEMLRRIEELQLEVQALRGQVDELGFAMEGMKNRQKDLYLDVDRRIQRLEQAGLGGGVRDSAGGPGDGESLPGGVPGVQAPPAFGAEAASAAPVPGNAALGAGDTAQQAYERAFNTLRSGQYDQAIQQFQSYVAQFPTSDYADNAQYWLGEANYVTRRFQQAAAEFGKVLDNFPNSSKVPDASLKLGFSYYELGEYDKAREVLQKLTRQYPNTAASRLALERLQRMDREGR